MKELSSAAETMLNVLINRWQTDPYEYYTPRIMDSHAIAAVLHIAADQLLSVQWEGQMPVDTVNQIGINWARDALHVLANELENT